jgi:type I site-specific restriction endonuclease
MDKKSLSERDICTKFITPALRQAGWDEKLQIREEVSFTKGRIIVRGKLVVFVGKDHCVAIQLAPFSFSKRVLNE